LIPPWNFDFFSSSLDGLRKTGEREYKLEKLTDFDIASLSFLLLDLLDGGIQLKVVGMLLR